MSFTLENLRELLYVYGVIPVDARGNKRVDDSSGTLGEFFCSYGKDQLTKERTRSKAGAMRKTVRRCVDAGARMLRVLLCGEAAKDKEPRRSLRLLARGLLCFRKFARAAQATISVGICLLFFRSE